MLWLLASNGAAVIRAVHAVLVLALAWHPMGVVVEINIPSPRLMLIIRMFILDSDVPLRVLPPLLKSCIWMVIDPVEYKKYQ